MKYIITVIFTFIFFTSAYSFTPQDSTSAGHNGQQIKEQVRVQEKGNKNQEALKQNKRGKDVFIDKDGDGICDQRVKGMGFKRGQKGHRQNGNGQGQGQGQGGNGSGSGSGNGNGNGH